MLNIKREKRIGPRQSAFLKHLITCRSWVYLNKMKGHLDTPLSRNHKYYMAKDYDARGFIERRYERDDHNRPVTLVRITKLGVSWYKYHTLGLLYEDQGFFTPKQRKEYEGLIDTLKTLNFTFQRDYNPDKQPLVKQHMLKTKRTFPGQQLTLF